MKKFIIGFMCMLLFSCHPVYAEIKTQESATFSDVNEEISLCKDIAAFAYVAMQARQYGVSKEAQLSLAPVPTTQEQVVLKGILEEIVHDATIFPIYDDVSDKVEVSERFSKVVYDICKGDK